MCSLALRKKAKSPKNPLSLVDDLGGIHRLALRLPIADPPARRDYANPQDHREHRSRLRPPRNHRTAIQIPNVAINTSEYQRVNDDEREQRELDMKKRIRV